VALASKEGNEKCRLVIRPNSIKIIVLDLDGVVFETSIFANRLSEKHGISREQTAQFFRESFVKCQLGQADLAEELPRYLPEWGWTSTTDAFLEFWFACDYSPRQLLLDEIAALRRTGTVCCLATNQERHRCNFLCSRMGLEQHFDKVFWSHQLGYRKPSAAFFHAIEQQFGLASANFSIWDDSVENVDSARAQGWDA